MLLVKATFVPTNFFSVKRAESYQFAPSYLLPPPSTLLGAFARGLFLLKGMSAPKNEEEAASMIIAATIRALTPLARSGVILKRMRTLEPREETEKEQFKPRTDAMVREVVSLPRMEGYYLLDENKASKSLGQEINVEIKRIIYSIDRLGDSESLVSVISVDISAVEAMKCPSEVNVNTTIEKDLTETVSGDYIYTIMPDLRDRRKPREYYVPLSVPKRTGVSERTDIFVRTDVYHPSIFRVIPKENTLMVSSQEVFILFIRDRQ